MRRGDGVRELFARTWFPRLLTTRLVAQCADGIFQTSLASAVFFNPDHQTDPHQAAAGFVVLLLPYSLVSPFAGVFLDRWRRRQVLVRANLVRTGFILTTAGLLLTTGARGLPFYVAALAALSMSRLCLSALSAALPHVVGPEQLIHANSVTTTAGTFIAIVGGGIGLGVRQLAGAGDAGSAAIAMLASVVYLAAAAVAATMPMELLGPGRVERQPLHRQLSTVARGLAAGARHVIARPRAARALAVMGTTRLLFGLSTIATLLLYRNYFHDEGALRAGLVGLGQAFAAAAVGYVAAAVLTPVVAARLGKQRWIVVLLSIASTTQLATGLPFAMAPLLVGAALLGFTIQGTKICVDTVVQEEVEDAFRGRVFSLYDALFNLTFVAAAAVAAFALPTTGKSYPVLFAVVAGYALAAIGYGASERSPRPEVTAAAAATAA
ncbi:MAG TPA: MFS transporter [Mycobacteriales bacterium]|nr:MFS transporter [Mycobacteriales bacterium]